MFTECYSDFSFHCISLFQFLLLLLFLGIILHLIVLVFAHFLSSNFFLRAPSTHNYYCQEKLAKEPEEGRLMAGRSAGSGLGGIDGGANS